MSRPATASSRANRRTALVMTGIVVAMAGMSYAAVPLYSLFCQVTGYGGTTQRVAAPSSQAVGTRMITVRFDASIAGRDLPWTFEPEQRQVTVRVGEPHLAFYRARNNSNQPVIGTATYNVTPHKAGPYFDKVACFCFNEQHLAAGETADLGVSFYVDPRIAEDPNLEDVDTITLSYTFFRAKDDPARPRTVGSNTSTPAPAVN
jgi:cytochrome c oxidase assembly protein subunit 11